MKRSTFKDNYTAQVGGADTANAQKNFEAGFIQDTPRNKPKEYNGIEN